MKICSARVHILFLVSVHPAVWAVVALLLVVAAMAAVIGALLRKVNSDDTKAKQEFLAK